MPLQGTAWYDVTTPVPMKPALLVHAHGMAAAPPLADPYLYAVTHVDKWFQQASETRKPAIGAGVADLLGGTVAPIKPPVDTFASQYLQYVQASPEPRRPVPGIASLIAGQAAQNMTPDVDLAQLRFLPRLADVLPRPRPAIYPQNPSEGVPSVTFAFTVDLWYQPASQPLPRLSSRIEPPTFTQPLEMLVTDQRLAWLTPPPGPLPPRAPRSTVPLESATWPILTPAMRANFAWYIAPAGPLPISRGIAGTQTYQVPMPKLPSTVIVSGPFFTTAIVVYAAGMVAFDEEPSQ